MAVWPFSRGVVSLLFCFWNGMRIEVFLSNMLQVPVDSMVSSGVRLNDVDLVSLESCCCEMRKTGSGFTTGLIIACLVLGNLAVSGCKWSNSEFSPDSGVGTLSEEQFVACWNGNSESIDRLYPDRFDGESRFYRSGDKGIVVRISNESLEGIAVFENGAEKGRYIRQGMVAVQCASGLSFTDSVELYTSLLDGGKTDVTTGESVGILVFDEKEYSFYLSGSSVPYPVLRIRPQQ